MVNRASASHCNNNCKAPRCKGLSKRSGFTQRCCLCTKHASGLCFHHQRSDGPEIQPRRPDRATVVGGGVRTAPSTLGAAAGRGLFANQNFASSDIITRYEPDRTDHRNQDLLSRAEARSLGIHTHIAHKDGNYVSGLRAPVQSVGGGSFANDPGSHSRYNAELFVHPTRLNHIYLRALAGKTIRKGDEIFINYGQGRSVAMGNQRM